MFASKILKRRALLPTVVDRAVAVLPSPLSQKRLIWRRFRRHRLALLSAIFLIPLYMSTLFVEFIAPFPVDKTSSTYVYAPPQTLYLFERDENGTIRFAPYVNGYLPKWI